MQRITLGSLLLLGVIFSWAKTPAPLRAEKGKTTALQVGFAECDITPKLGGKPVYMAGFGHNRKAEKVHDPLMARAFVIKQGDQKLAIVSVDLVGFSHTDVINVRKQLPGFTYVLVTSTHSHEGPDTIGLWGPNFLSSGIDKDYMRFVEGQIVKAVCDAEGKLNDVTASIGMAKAPELLHDGREPYVLHDELVALEFFKAGTKERTGIVIQWNCHPETLGGSNTEVSADYVGYTVKHLQEQFHCPVVYLTGTVGGLMTSLHVEIKDEKGQSLKDGTFEKTARYGELLAYVGGKALKAAKPVTLTPMRVAQQEFFIPLDNRGYQHLRQLGVLQRDAFLWTCDPLHAEPAEAGETKKRLCMKTEAACITLGDLQIAAIPGEIYPELVLDKIQDPQDPAADFQGAAKEPAIYKQMKGPHRMIVGLANDEIGYIIPKSQWDEKPPFCYGRTKTQYGEINSVGPETAPILCKVFKELCASQ